MCLVGCGGQSSSSNRATYSFDDLARGVDMSVRDEAADGAAVAEAQALLGESIAVGSASRSALDREGVIVLPGDRYGFDVVVVYRTGPFCGLLPQVVVSGTVTALTVAVTSFDVGECEAIRYDEAVGLTLTAGYEHASVGARHDVTRPDSTDP